jgi:hypothetical protein
VKKRERKKERKKERSAYIEGRATTKCLIERYT